MHKHYIINVYKMSRYYEYFIFSCVFTVLLGVRIFILAEYVTYYLNTSVYGTWYWCLTTQQHKNSDQYLVLRVYCRYVFRLLMLTNDRYTKTLTTTSSIPMTMLFITQLKNNESPSFRLKPTLNHMLDTQSAKRLLYAIRTA